MIPPVRSQLLSCVALAMLASAAQAINVPVPNGSFETPNKVGAAPYYANFPLNAPNVFGAWEQDATTFNAVYEAGRYGVIPTGLAGAQAATLSATASSGIYQDTVDYAGTGDASLYWQAGQTYKLTIGIFMRSDNAPVAASVLDLRMFYRPADAGPANVLATTTVTRATSPLSTSAITDYDVTYTVPLGSPAIGKPIGIWITPTAPVPINQGDWGVDNLRLDVVPEPATGLLALLGGACLLRRRRG
jgi:hypothetical protein